MTQRSKTPANLVSNLRDKMGMVTDYESKRLAQQRYLPQRVAPTGHHLVPRRPIALSFLGCTHGAGKDDPG